jgi:hypothetical protein
MLRRWLSGGPRVPVTRQASKGENEGSQAGRETNDGDARGEVWRIAALRAVGSLSLAFLSAVVALWFFVFWSVAWQGLISLPVGGFLGSWISAALGVEGATRHSQKRSGFAVGLGAATNLARWSFFFGIFGFVFFVLMAYR